MDSWGEGCSEAEQGTNQSQKCPTGKNDGIWIAARDPDSFCKDPPSKHCPFSGFYAKPSFKQLICRSECSQRPTNRCKFAVRVPLSKETSLLHFFLLPPKYPARLYFIVASCRSELKILQTCLQTCIHTILHLPTPMDLIPGEQKTTSNK